LSWSAISVSSEPFNTVSQQMGANAEETAAQSNVETVASEEVNNNVQSVVEERSVTIRKIARCVRKATEAGNSANATIVKRGESSTEIGRAS
jgi:hypothetical protein